MATCFFKNAFKISYYRLGIHFPQQCFASACKKLCEQM